MQRPAIRLLETIIRHELFLLCENHHETFTNDYSDESNIKKSAPVTNKPYTGDLKKYEGKTVPNPTAGSLQKFFGLSVDGQFGDCTAEAVANFIYGPKTGHGIRIDNCKNPKSENRGKAVELLYSRMKQDGWTVGAKTGTIFANNGEMAKSIIELMRQRASGTGFGKYSGLSTRYINHPAYSNYPFQDQVKFGLDYGGRNKWSTVALKDFMSVMKQSEKDGKDHPYKPEGYNSKMTQEEASEIFGEFIKYAYIGVKTPTKWYIPGVSDSNCDSINKLIASLGTVTIEQLQALESIAQDNGQQENIFNFIISYGRKYYPNIDRQQKDGTDRTTACIMYPESLEDIWRIFDKVDQHIRDLFNGLDDAEDEVFQRVGDQWIPFKKNIAKSLFSLGQYLDAPIYPGRETNHMITTKSSWEGVGKYGLTGAGGGAGMATYYLFREDPHTFLLISGLLAEFIPVIGWALSAGIFAADAALYYKEKEYFSAGISGLFAALPMLRKIPLLKNYTKAFFDQLGIKLSSEAAVKLTVAEQGFITSITKNKIAIQRQIQSLLKKEITKTLPKTINYSTIANEPIAIIMRKVVNGTLNLERIAKFKGSQIGAVGLGFFTTIKAWEFLYEITGLKEKELRDKLADPSYVNKIINTESDKLERSAITRADYDKYQKKNN